MADDLINHRALRDEIERAIAEVPWWERAKLQFIGGLDTPHNRKTLAGIIRKALGPQLARLHEDRDALNRVRHVLRQHQGSDAIPRRQLEAAIYGDEDYLNAR